MTFVEYLTRASSAEIKQYVVEISSDKKFHEQLERTWQNFSRRSSVWWAPGVGKTLGMAIYVLCRELKPSHVVETGVSTGVSSSYILHALAKNQYGLLHSVDFPQYDSPPNHNISKPETGWLIPEGLRERWHLTIGKSQDKLIPVLEKIQTIDVFLHDSEHTYQNMMWEYRTVWHYLRIGGVLLSHNIDMNSAFPNFCRNTSSPFFYFAGMGGTSKTGTSVH